MIRGILYNLRCDTTTTFGSKRILFGNINKVVISFIQKKNTFGKKKILKEKDDFWAKIKTMFHWNEAFCFTKTK